MADIKISQLGEALAVIDNDVLPMTASGVTSKVKASTMKDYMIGNTNISGLGDGTPTGAIDALDDEIDANYAEWKTQWKKNGAYNLLENTLVTEVDRGVAFTVNNGVVTLSGTSESAIYKRVKTFTGGFPVSLRTGETYKLVGCQTNTSNVRLVIQENNNDIAYDSGNGATFTQQAWDNTKSSFVYIEIPSGKNVDGIVLKPMITTDLNATYADYVPYAKTNLELTEDIAIKDISSSISTGTPTVVSSQNSVIHAMRFGKLIVLDMALDIITNVPNTTVTFLTGLPIPSTPVYLVLSKTGSSPTEHMTLSVNSSGEVVKLSTGATFSSGGYAGQIVYIAK